MSISGNYEDINMPINEFPGIPFPKGPGLEAPGSKVPMMSSARPPSAEPQAPKFTESSEIAKSPFSLDLGKGLGPELGSLGSKLGNMDLEKGLKI